MQYWRMQLHPGMPENATRFAVESIAAGFIGLDFLVDPGDLRLAERSALPAGQRDYYDFAHKMAIGDRVLVIVHHFPFALVTVNGEYNYIRCTEPEIGVWFKHFRRIDRQRTSYYADRKTNVREWEQLRMTDTISILKDPDGKSYRLIEAWD
jgi:hypothetical protein